MGRVVITSEKAKNVLWLIAYYIIISMVYIFWLSPAYSYQGFQLSMSAGCLLFGSLIMLIASFCVATLIERDGISDTILTLVVLLYFYPQMVLYSFGLNDTKYFLYVIFYMFSLLLVNRYFPVSPNKVQIKERANLFEVVLVILGLSMILISGTFAGFRISFDLSDYYEYRFEVREMAMPTIIKYVLNWARTLLPIGFTYALVKRKKRLILFTAIAQVLCFSFDGKKSALFMFILAFVVSLIFRSSYRKKMPFFMSILGLLVFLESAVRAGESFVGKHILRRMMFVPPYLGWAYFDFFSTNELDYLKSSILRWVGFKSTYSESIPRLIGRMYYLSSSSGAVNANTGLCGDAFSNFGWWSLLFYPLMNILIFKIIGKYSAGLDERLQIIISLTVAYTFLSGSFFSVLLTNGILLLVVLLILLPKQELLSQNSQGR